MPMFIRSISTVALSIAALLSTTCEAFAVPATVVLVHGAFADGSSWHEVIPLLEKDGLRVVAVQLPLTSLADDVAATNRAIDRIEGPVTLVGHSWGGTVITEAGNADKVKSLVYIAALANRPGTSYQDMVKSYPSTPGGAEVQVDKAGFATLSADGIVSDFAPDLTPAEQAIVAATQGPIRAANFSEKTSANAAWATKPSWFIVAGKDRMLPVSLEEKMASDIHAQTTIIDSSHVVMLTHPQAVARTIEAAATSH
jgi:pimeloyl-ACP methyl ester carboxylesterase